jgi:hypothetical protein
MLLKGVKMTLLTTDIFAIIIALSASCAVMIVGLKAHANVMQENKKLRQALNRV